MTRNILVIFYSALLLCSFFVFYGDGNQEMKIAILLTIGIVSMFMLLISKKSAGIKYFIQPVHLFLLAYMIVFFQRPIDYKVGLFDSAFYLGNVKLMPQCLFLSDIGLIFFLLGYIVKFSPRPNLVPTYTIIPSPPKPFAFFTLFLILLMLIFVPRSVLMGGYGQGLLGGASTYNYFSSWVHTFIVAYLLQTILYYKHNKIGEDYNIVQFIRSLGWLQNFNLILFTWIILNVGDRGPLIVLAMSYYMAYLIVSKRGISKKVLLGGLVVAILVVSFLGQTKSFRDNNSIAERVVEAQENTAARQATSIAIATEELANSYMCLPYSIEMINIERDYFNGQFLLSNLFGSFPFLGGISQKLFDLPSSSSDILSKYINGDDYDWGTGTSCIADFFLDGGVVFIIIGMLGWGLLLKYFEQRVLVGGTRSVFVLCLGFYFMIHTIYIPRSVVLTPLKYGLLLFVIVWEYNVIMQKVKLHHGK